MTTNITEHTDDASPAKLSPIVITIHEIDIKLITNELDVKCDIKIMSIGRKVFANSIDDKEKICDALKHNKVDYYSHSNVRNKNFKAVLSDLPQVKTDEIMHSLKTDNIDTSTLTMFATNSQNKLYL